MSKQQRKDQEHRPPAGQDIEYSDLTVEQARALETGSDRPELYDESPQPDERGEVERRRPGPKDISDRMPRREGDPERKAGAPEGEGGTARG